MTCRAAGARPGALALLLAMLWLAVAAPAALLAASRPLPGFKHVAWSMEAGAPSRVNAITQSADGYLWIASVDGLFRFDGVSFERIAASDPRLQRPVVSQVLAARSGEVWAGLARGDGVAVYRNGRLVDAGMPNPSREVNDLAQGPDGDIWVARGGRSTGALARYHQGRWEEIGPSWNLPEGPVWQIRFTRDGSLWVVLSDALVVRRPGARRFEATGEHVTPRAGLAEDAAGRLWISDAVGTRIVRLSAGAPANAAARAYPHPRKVGGIRMLFDRAGRLWGTTWNEGVFVIPRPGEPAGAAGDADPAVSAFDSADGLTSDQTHALFQDREGNLWIGTELGLDMFRPAAMAIEPRIAPNPPSSYRMASASEGVVYVADASALYAAVPGRPLRAVMRLPSAAESLCPATGGGVWLALEDRMLRIRGAAVQRFDKPEPFMAYGCAEDRQGRLWAPALEKGLFWLQDGRWRRWPGLTPTVGLPANAVTGPDGRAAILFRTRPPALADAPFTPLFNGALPIGGIEGIFAGRDALFVAGRDGLARLRGGAAQVLPADTRPWLASINGLVQTPAGDTWTIGDAGIVRVSSDALAHAFDDPGQALPYRLFDFRDGLNSFPQKAPGPQAAVTGDGRVWFLTRRNVVRIDPSQLATNMLPPPVLIRTLTAGAESYADPANVTLRAGSSSLVIGYTALSLSVPNRVRFRYRLDGVDKDWVEAGDRRAAVYSDLGPGEYRFHVVAANNDGVWNPAGATVSFVIPPTFYQTWLFRALCAMAVILAFWAALSIRLRQATARLRDQWETRLGERQRIARELHDTLLQGVQGLIMRFQAVANRLPEEDPARQAMDRALDRAELMLMEGRDRLHDLRRADARDLESVLRELAMDQDFPPDTRLSVVSQGEPRPLEPHVLDEVVRISGEALFNAALHAQADEVKISIIYGVQKLVVSFEDDGVGADARAAQAAGRKGHFGLVGMRERARRLDGSLAFETAPGAGAKITLSLPARIAYAPTPRRPRKAGRGLAKPA
ncbi:sensor histidine kinase [Caulobacter sp. KR2-114]|uniref:sensor histidine kinase n=1 Tax=Caulobacter sp. KR2-114 TaxID=3400912 RepID=UPI003BFDAFB3